MPRASGMWTRGSGAAHHHGSLPRNGSALAQRHHPRGDLSEPVPPGTNCCPLGGGPSPQRVGYPRRELSESGDRAKDKPAAVSRSAGQRNQQKKFYSSTEFRLWKPRQLSLYAFFQLSRFSI